MVDCHEGPSQRREAQASVHLDDLACIEIVVIIDEVVAQGRQINRQRDEEQCGTDGGYKP